MENPALMLLDQPCKYNGIKIKGRVTHGPFPTLHFKSVFKAVLQRTSYLLSLPPLEPAVFLAPATKNIFPDVLRPPLLAEVEWKDC